MLRLRSLGFARNPARLICALGAMLIPESLVQVLNRERLRSQFGVYPCTLCPFNSGPPEKRPRIWLTATTQGTATEKANRAARARVPK